MLQVATRNGLGNGGGFIMKKGVPKKARPDYLTTAA
jgi:hypothetical protein